MTRLCVNVDHVATLRQARRAAYPDPVEAAARAEAAGAAGITVHLRGDRRHIQEDDVASLRRSVRGKLNLEMAATEEMQQAALAVRPDQVTLVPERPEEVTTEGGLNLLTQSERILKTGRRLRQAGIEVSVFLDPERAQIQRLLELRAGEVAGFEINTDSYTKAEAGGVEAELEKVSEAAVLGRGKGLRVYAGHGLNVSNVGPIAAIREIEELNIGHSIVSRAVLVGMEAAVKEMLEAMETGSRR